MREDSKLLPAKINDLFTLCDKRCAPQFSAFLDGGEQAVIEDEFRIPCGYNVMLFGGFDSAERKLFGVFPEWSEPEKEEFPIAAVRFKTPDFRTLTHRDYLGTLMSLGIDRNKTGDILADKDGAYVFVAADIAEYVMRNVTKIANTGVTSQIVDIADIELTAPQTREYECVCASLRLDAVMAGAYGISRANAEKLIHAGCVKVNHREVTDRSKQLNAGDLLSVRGYGRCVLKDTGVKTRSGRLHITVEKFV